MNSTDRARISRLVEDIDSVLEADPHANVVATMDLLYAIKEDLKSVYHDSAPGSVVYLRNLARSHSPQS